MFKVTFAGRFGARIDVRAELHLRLYEIASTIGLIPAPHYGVSANSDIPKLGWPENPEAL